MKMHFTVAKIILLSHPMIRRLLADPYLEQDAPEKLTRLIGILSFICLDGSWNEDGTSEVENKSFSKFLEQCSISIKDCPYGDIFRPENRHLQKHKSKRTMVKKSRLRS